MQPAPTPQPPSNAPEATLNGLALEIALLRQAVAHLSVQLQEFGPRLRSVEDDRLKAWTVVGVMSVFGLSGAAAMLKWILTG
jgi:hypothetical protein